MNWEKPLKKSILGGVLAVLGIMILSGSEVGAGLFPYLGVNWHSDSSIRAFLWGALVSTAGGIVDRSFKMILFDGVSTGLATCACHYICYRICILLGEGGMLFAGPGMILFLGVGLSSGISISRLLSSHFQCNIRKEIYAMLRRTCSACALCLGLYVFYNFRIFDFKVKWWGLSLSFYLDFLVAAFGMGAGLYIAEIWEQKQCGK